ncbi:MAG: hypothetical protein V4472_17575 [Pseudomonadota bacterium]
MKKPRRWGQPGWWLAPDALAHASPILVDALAAAGLDLDRMLDTAGEEQAGMLGVLRVHPLRREGGSVQMMDTAGVLRRCEIQRRGDCLEVSLSLGAKAFVTTNRDRAELAIAMTIPETLRIAAKGRPLRGIIDHPLLRRDAYRVRRVRDFSRLGVVVIGFDTPMTTVDAAIAERLDPRVHEA